MLGNDFSTVAESPDMYIWWWCGMRAFDVSLVANSRLRVSSGPQGTGRQSQREYTRAHQPDKQQHNAILIRFRLPTYTIYSQLDITLLLHIGRYRSHRPVIYCPALTNVLLFVSFVRVFFLFVTNCADLSVSLFRPARVHTQHNIL